MFQFVSCRYMQKTLVVCFFLIQLFPIGGYAQIFTAHVKEVDKHVFIEGASIIAKNGLSLTDKEGFFKIKAKVGDSLIIRSIGYQTKIYIVTNFTNAETISLYPTPATLKDIEVNAKLGTKLLTNIHRLDLSIRPLNNSQEVLRMVPGLFIGQHAGGGKAEQLFIRGFDIDHGTDVNVSVDGLPVNMVSHAHGQGYADLHFVIPETIKDIDFGKGTYYADKGDFTTAGYVSLQTFDKIANNLLKVEGGMFNTLRTVGMFNMLPKQKQQNAFVAAELYHTNGPFTSPQNFKRYNVLAKYQLQKGNSIITSQLSTFWSKWNASGQIPNRAIADGSIGWFGAIDDNEGGQTARTNVSVKINTTLPNDAKLENQVYFTNYNFELYSNFTFYFFDPINGDQIRQKEARYIFGYNGTYTKDYYFKNGGELQTKIGAAIRFDDINHLELTRTVNRYNNTTRLSNGTGAELNVATYLNETYKINRWTVNGALRVDEFVFNYTDLLNNGPSKSVNKAIISPKLNFQYQLNKKVALYLKSGKGFHSNDIRVVASKDGKEVLPAAWGSDLGIIAKPLNNLIINMALWVLKLNQEFVYVGDGAVVEPGGKTFRKGIDVSVRHELAKNLFTDIDVNYAIGRAISEPVGMQYLPLAPAFSATGGLNYNGRNLKAGLRFRSLGERPANEDNSIKAYGYTIFDANLNYKISKTTSFGFSAENIFNTKWRETQFLTESKLQQEIIPVEEIHFTPGTPLFIKARILFEF